MPKSNKGGSVLPALVAAGVLATGAKMYEDSLKKKGSRKVKGGASLYTDYNNPLVGSSIDQSYMLDTGKSGSVVGASEQIPYVEPGMVDKVMKMMGGKVKKTRKVKGGLHPNNNDYSSPHSTSEPTPVDQSYLLLPTETTGAFNPDGNLDRVPFVSPQSAAFTDKQIGGKKTRKTKKGGAGTVLHSFPYIPLNPAPIDPNAPTNILDSGNDLFTMNYAKSDFGANQIGGKKSRKMKKGGDGEDVVAQGEDVAQEAVPATIEQCEAQKAVLLAKIEELEGELKKQTEEESVVEVVPADGEQEVTGGAKKRKGKKVRGGVVDFPAFAGSPAALEQATAANAYAQLPVGPIDPTVAPSTNAYPIGGTALPGQDIPAYDIKKGGAKKSRKMKKGGGSTNPNMGLFTEPTSVAGAEGPKTYPFVDASDDPLYGMPVTGGAKKTRKSQKGGVHYGKFSFREENAAANHSDALSYPGGQFAATSAVAKADQIPLTGGSSKKGKKTTKGGTGSSPVQKGEGPAAADQSNALSLFAGRYASTAAAGNIPPADASTLLYGGAKKSRKMKKGGGYLGDERPAIKGAYNPEGVPSKPDVDERPFAPNMDVTQPIGGPSQNVAYDAATNAKASLYTANTSGMAGGNCGCVAGGAPRKSKKSTLKANIKALAKKLSK